MNIRCNVCKKNLQKKKYLWNKLINYRFINILDFLGNQKN